MPDDRFGLIGLLEPRDGPRVELQRQGGDRVVEMMGLGRPDDRRGDIRLRQHPGERDDGRLHLELDRKSTRLNSSHT